MYFYLKKFKSFSIFKFLVNQKKSRIPNKRRLHFLASNQLEKRQTGTEREKTPDFKVSLKVS